MTDEELRTFCVEQAVLIFAKKEQVKTMGFRDMEDMTLLELSDRLYNYIRTGEQSFIPASLSYLKKNNTDLFINRDYPSDCVNRKLRDFSRSFFIYVLTL